MQPALHVGERVKAHLFSVFVLSFEQTRLAVAAHCRRQVFCDVSEGGLCCNEGVRRGILAGQVVVVALC